ncbi:hypothetical protein [Sphingomonas faeni]|uniref:hypothetical protein n=1 Tax=Sphingomonas faeni TaxID=185950 RepID=UPI003345D2D2
MPEPLIDALVVPLTNARAEHAADMQSVADQAFYHGRQRTSVRATLLPFSELMLSSDPIVMNVGRNWLYLVKIKINID